MDQPTPRHRQLGRGPRAAGVCLILLLAGSCSSYERRSSMMKTSPNVVSSAAEVRIKIQSLAGPFGGEIEVAADAAIARAKDPAVRRELLLWKIETVPGMYASLLRADPLLATTDGWAFVAQMSLYFEHGPGSRYPPEVLEPILSMLERLDSQMGDLLLQIAPTANRARTKTAVYDWAHSHPITHFEVRESVSMTLASEAAGSSRSLAATAGGVQDSIEDLLQRLDLYSGYLSKSARWQAELGIEDGLSGVDLANVSAATAKASAAIDELSRLMQQLPGTAGEQRDLILAALTEQRKALVDALEKQTIAATGTITAERVAFLEGIERERTAAFNALQAERIATMEAISQQRIAATADAERISKEVVEHSMKGIVDYALRRVILLVAVYLGVFFVGNYLLLRYTKRP